MTAHRYRKGTVLGIAILAVLGPALLAALIIDMAWSDATARNVTFVNDTSLELDLPDCSTDLAFLNAHDTVKLPVASDHPHDCTIDGPRTPGGKEVLLGCVTLPDHLDAHTIIRLSARYRHRCHT